MAWHVSGEYMESCSCDYLCPCIYTNPQGKATKDYCTALMAFRVDKGEADGVDLAGTAFVFIIKTGPVMADGNWIFANVVDAETDEQADALAKIAGGEAGGVPGMLRDAVVTDYRGVTRAKIEIGMEGHARSVRIPGVLDFAIEGVTSRNRAELGPIRLENTGHPANAQLALAQASEMRLDAFGLTESIIGEGNNGHFAPFDWEG